MGRGIRIVYDEDGYPRELSGSEEWHRAIIEGRLTPETAVTVYRSGVQPIVRKAGEVAELRILFEASDAEGDGAEPTDAAAVQIDARPEIIPASPEPAVPPIAEEPKAASEERPGRAEAPDREGGSSAQISAGKWMGAIAATALVAILMLVLTLWMNRDRVPSTGAMEVPGSDPQPPATMDDAVTIVEGKVYEWTDASGIGRYRLGALTVTLAVMDDSAEGGSVPTATVALPDLGEGRLVGVSGLENASARFALVRLTAGDPNPSLLLLTFSGGAHCCTNIKLLVPGKGAWQAVDLGDWDGEPLADAPVDVDEDGIVDFLLNDNAFLYSFASYAESHAPSLIYNVRNGKVVDVSDSPRFAAIHRRDMEGSRADCVQGNNGACAAFVASAARLGEEDSAFRVANESYDRNSSWELPTRCSLPLEGGECPPGSEQRPADFPEALRWFLEDRKYLSRSGRSLDDLLAFSNPSGCEFGRELSDLFRQLNGPAIEASGIGRINVTHRRLGPGEHGSEWASQISIARLEGRWLGLRVSALANVGIPESDGVSLQIRFSENAEKVRSVLNANGFQLPAVGEAREIANEMLPASIGVERIPDGAVLFCST